MTKTFLLGLGAQKCGTTWLYRTLNARKDVNMGFTKEYHILDAIHVPECEMFRRRYETATRKAIQEGFDTYQFNPGRRDIQRLSFVADVQTYYAYFTDLLSRSHVQCSGDVTPTYCALSEPVLASVKSEFARRGIAVRPVFLMREPVQRLRSLVKMRFRKLEVVPSKAQELEAMRDMGGSAYDRIRSDYATTLQNLDAVFGAEAFVGFYETLFQQETIDRITDLLGLPGMTPDFQQAFNVSRSDNTMTAEDLAPFRNLYTRQYEALDARFGAATMREIWP